MIAIYVNAGNDSNGNPRRGWIIADPSGNFVDFVDHGYEGTGALKPKYPGIPRTPEIEVKPSVYRDLVRQSRAR